MNIKIKYYIISFLITLIPIVLYKNERNTSAEFCTTRAYGWPFPIKMEYCECNGGVTVSPPNEFIIGNLILIVVIAYVLSIIFKHLSKSNAS